MKLMGSYLTLARMTTCVGLLCTAASAGPMGPLAVHPDNPRYFQNTATGELVFLTGSHTWANLVDMSPADAPEAFDFEAYVDWMAQFGHNFMRLWTWELVSWDITHNKGGKLHVVRPLRYARTGPGLARDGKPKFDLTKFNPEYFDRLKTRVAMARQRGIYPAVMLFEGWGIQLMPGAWEAHPFHPDNNINGIGTDVNGVEIHELGHPKILAIQEAYVRHVIDTVNEFDNVLYEISNENHPPSTEWQYHMIRFIKNYEKTKPHQHPVGMTFQYKGGKNQTLFDSPADWISPNPDGGYRDDPPAADGRKVIVNDTDHLWGIGGNQTWVWKSFLRGLNPIFMDPYNGSVLGQSENPQWDPIRKSMGDAANFAKKLDLVHAVPSTEIASTTYCLANPGKQYLVFKPAGVLKSFKVTLSAGAYAYEWFDPTQGQHVPGGQIQATDGKQKFTVPFKGDAILYIEHQ